MKRHPLDLLECHACHDRLIWDIREEVNGRIEAGDAVCRACAAKYPVREGVGLFLTTDLPRIDPWQQTDSQLARHLREHPEVRARLMESALHELGPADRFSALSPWRRQAVSGRRRIS